VIYTPNEKAPQTSGVCGAVCIEHGVYLHTFDTTSIAQLVSVSPCSEGFGITKPHHTPTNPFDGDEGAFSCEEDKTPELVALVNKLKGDE